MWACCLCEHAKPQCEINIWSASRYCYLRITLQNSDHFLCIFIAELKLLQRADINFCVRRGWMSHVAVVVMKKTSIWIQTKQQFWEQELAEVQPVAWLSFTPHPQIMKQCRVHFTPRVSVISKPICNIGGGENKKQKQKKNPNWSVVHVIVSQLSHSTPKPHLSPNYPDLAPFDFKCLAVDLTRSCVNHKNTRENCSEQCRE